jgi:hypothetical protein
VGRNIRTTPSLNEGSGTVSSAVKPSTTRLPPTPLGHGASPDNLATPDNGATECLVRKEILELGARSTGYEVVCLPPGYGEGTHAARRTSCASAKIRGPMDGDSASVVTRSTFRPRSFSRSSERTRKRSNVLAPGENGTRDVDITVGGGIAALVIWSQYSSVYCADISGRMETHKSQMNRWVRLTSWGWILGVLLTVLGAAVGDGLGVSGSQTAVGLGMGAGVGIMQRRFMRDAIPNSAAWAISSAAGLAAPFVAVDILRAAGLNLPYSLYACVAIGGLVAGLCQAVLLRRSFAKTWTWVPGSVLGWSIAAATAAGADYLPKALSLRGLAGAGVYLCFALAGGPLLGLVSGLFLPPLDHGEARIASQ